MSAGTAVLANFDSDEFNVKVYESLTRASQVLVNIKTKGQVLFLSARLWQLNGRLEKLMTDLKDITEGNKQVESVEPLTPARSEHAISSLEELSRVLSYIYEQSRRRGLTNNSLIAGSLARMNKYSDCLIDIADWLHVLIQEHELHPIFERGHNERLSGAYTSIS